MTIPCQALAIEEGVTTILYGVHLRRNSLFGSAEQYYLLMLKI